MSLQNAFALGAAGLSAQRTRMETLVSNMVNVNTTRTEGGGPYRRLMPIFAAEPIQGSVGDRLAASLRSVRVEGIVEDPSPPLLRFEPGHPDADESGFVAYPDINMVEEMTDMISATRSYEASVTVVRNVRDMMRAALEIIA